MNKETSSELKVQGWYLKKEVTIGNLIVLITLIISGLWWASSVETKLAQLTSEDKRIEEKTMLLVASVKDGFDLSRKETLRELKRINVSINRLGSKIDNKQDK